MYFSFPIFTAKKTQGTLVGSDVTASCSVSNTWYICPLSLRKAKGVDASLLRSDSRRASVTAEETDRGSSFSTSQYAFRGTFSYEIPGTVAARKGRVNKYI